MSTSDPFWEHVEPEIPWAHALLRRFGVPERDLDDVTQHVLVQVHGRWTEYDRARPLRPWLMAFLVRAAANHRRWMLRRREQLGATNDVGDTVPDTGEQPDARVIARDAHAVVHEALSALDDDQRTAVVLVDLEELSAPDAARTLGIPLNTVYSRLRLGRAEFTAAVRRIRARRGER